MKEEVFMSDYFKTPSFYNNDEVFKKYLGQTSHYLSLQNGVSKVVGLTNPKEILELGSGTGATSNRLAVEHPFCKITSVDMRKEMVKVGTSNALALGIDNVSFIEAEMVNYVCSLNKLPEFVVLLYSFHHIQDPLQNKIDFLKECKSKMPDNGILLIGDVFLSESLGEISCERAIKSVWLNRMYESYSSTFWASLEGLSSECIEKSRAIANYSKDNEWEAGNLVWKRQNEYVISLSDFNKIINAVGLKVVLAEPCNSVNDYIILLSK